MQWILRPDGHAVAEMKTLKLSNLAMEVTSIMHRYNSFGLELTFVIKFNSPSEKEQVVSFLSKRMVDIVVNKVLNGLGTCNCRGKYHCSIQIEKFLFQRPHILSTIEGSVGMDTVARTPILSNLHNKTFFRAWTDEGPLLVRAACKNIRNSI